MSLDCPAADGTVPTREMWDALAGLRAVSLKLKRLARKEPLFIIGASGERLLFGEPEVIPKWYKKLYADKPLGYMSNTGVVISQEILASQRSKKDSAR